MSAPDNTPQAVFLGERLEEVGQLQRDVARLVEELDADRFRQRPAPAAWSVAEVFEHLVIADSDYLVELRETVPRSQGAKLRDPGRPWRPTLAGRLLAGSMRTVRPGWMKSPARWRPPAPRENVVDAYRANLDELKRLIVAARGLDLSRVRTHSPVSRLIRLNLGDCFLILTAHGARHMRQIERILETLRATQPTSA